MTIVTRREWAQQHLPGVMRYLHHPSAVSFGRHQGLERTIYASGVAECAAMLTAVRRREFPVGGRCAAWLTHHAGAEGRVGDVVALLDLLQVRLMLAYRHGGIDGFAMVRECDDDGEGN